MYTALLAANTRWAQCPHESLGHSSSSANCCTQPSTTYIPVYNFLYWNVPIYTVYCCCRFYFVFVCFFMLNSSWKIVHNSWVPSSFECVCVCESVCVSAYNWCMYGVLMRHSNTQVLEVNCSVGAEAAWRRWKNNARFLSMGLQCFFLPWVARGERVREIERERER